MTLAAIGIAVKDLAASRSFYSRLGLLFPGLEEGEGHIEAVTSSGVRFMMDSHELMEGISAGWQHRPGTTPSLAFECGSPAEVDAKFAELVEAGARPVMTPWDAFWGQRYACLHDLDGHPLDLFAAQEASGSPSA